MFSSPILFANGLHHIYPSSFISIINAFFEFNHKLTPLHSHYSISLHLLLAIIITISKILCTKIPFPWESAKPFIKWHFFYLLLNIIYTTQICQIKTQNTLKDGKKLLRIHSFFVLFSLATLFLLIGTCSVIISGTPPAVI